MRPCLPRVSVIIPTYNRSELLRVAVESVLAQTYPNIEIIVVDDGSTDDTATMMAQYAERVTYLQQTNRGVAVARNTGFRAASGEYVTFLDDDDLIIPTKIERQMQVLASRAEVSLVHCGYYHTDEAGNSMDRVVLLPEGEVLRPLVCRNFIWVGAPLIRRQCLDVVGPFDEEIPSVSADWDMWLRIAQAGYPFACVQEPLGAYRIQRDSMLADVSGLEYATFTILDRVFSDPQLPADVVAVKEQAYGAWRFWISCRYYATGRWDDARRNLEGALALRPQLLNHLVDLVQPLCDEALSLRVTDPLQFVADVLDHLPVGAYDLRRCRSHLLGRVYVGLALRNYGVGNIADAKRELAEAVALDPTILKRTKDFADSLCHHAMCLLVEAPLTYVETVLQNLPAGAQQLERARASALSGVNVACAFQDYFTGHQGRAARRILSALRRRPSWLKNRGVVSVLVKSLPKLLTRGQATA
jgi:glycosyltransferase involved in cell wall biosynthesis